MRILRILLVVALSIVLIANAMVYLASLALEQTVLQPNIYEEVLSEHGVYSAILDTMRVRVAEQLNEVPEAYRDLMKAGFAQGLNEAWLKDQVSTVISRMLGYLKGETPTLSIPISLIDVKEPVIKAITEGFSSHDNKEVEQLLKEFNSFMPDRLDAVELMGGVDLTGIRRAVSTVPKIPGVSLGIGIFIVLLLWLLGGFQLASLRWPGMSLLLAGSLGVAIAVWGPFVSVAMLTREAMPGVPKELLSVDIPALFGGIFHEVARVLMLNAGVMAIIGLIMIIVAFLFGCRKESSFSKLAH